MCLRIITKFQCWRHVKREDADADEFYIFFYLDKYTLHLRKISASFLICACLTYCCCSCFISAIKYLFRCESKNPITTAVLFPIFPCVLEDFNCPRQTGKTHFIPYYYINYLYRLCFKCHQISTQVSDHLLKNPSSLFRLWPVLTQAATLNMHLWLLLY